MPKDETEGVEFIEEDVEPVKSVSKKQKKKKKVAAMDSDNKMKNVQVR